MRVLQIVHGLPPRSEGGTETYVMNLAHALARRPGVHVAVLAREADPERPELSLRHERRGAVDVRFINNMFATCTTFADTYRNPALAAVVAHLLDALNPEIVHIQHLTCLSTDLVTAVRSRHIPIVMTLNDYWPICHRGQLIDLHGRRCDGPGEHGCASCIPAGVIAPSGMWRLARRMRELPIPIVRSVPGAIERLAAAAFPANTRQLSKARAAHMRSVLGAVDLLLAPSATLHEQYVRFGVTPDRLQRCEQGSDVPWSVPTRCERGGPLRVIFAGSLILSKAPHLLLDAVERLPQGAVVVDFLGSVAPYHGDRRYAAALQRRLGHSSIRRSGPVPHGRVPSALVDADVLVVPSIWIENAPFIIREAFACGVPVLASRLGGMAEMVRDGVDGLLFEAGDASSLAAALARLIDEPSLLDRLRAGIRPVLTIDEDAAALHARYGALEQSQQRMRAVPPPPAASASAPPITAVVLDYRTPADTFLAARSIDTSIGANADTVIVANGAHEGPANELRDRLPLAQVLESTANLGFSGGCNLGIRHALTRGAEAILLLNSDAVLHPRALAELSRVLWNDERVGIAAAVTVSREEPHIIASAGMRYDPRTGRMRHLAAGRRFASLGTDPVRRVDGASGCALLIKRAVFERVGLLDDAYFFSFEDLEFCLRARAAGFDTVSVSNAIVYHQGARTIGTRSPKRVYYGVRNHLRLAQQIAPLGPATRLARSAVIVGLSAAYVVRSPEVPIGRGLLALMRGTFDYARGRSGG
jgi:GT2 family glycosyltransferase/glycosyltransferase involved in cell wall biosynthesis